MSLIPRLRLLFGAIVLLAAVGTLVIGVGASRGVVIDELALQNRESARLLAYSLPSFPTDGEAATRVLLGLFDGGAYRSLRLRDAEGRVRFERSAAEVTLAPEWFARWLSLQAEAGMANLEGEGATGWVEVVRSAAPAVDAIWHTTIQVVLGYVLVALAVATSLILTTRNFRRQLDRVVEQAESLQQSDYLPAAEVGGPELRRLGRALNAVASRWRQAFETHTAELDLMRMEANRDPLTGLSNRAHFFELLKDGAPDAGAAPVRGLVLLRLMDLASINHALGHAATDRIIRAIAQAFQTYTRRVDGCFVGRLNGSDFALGLSAGGVACETAQALVELLRAALPAFGGGISVVAGCIEIGAGAEVSVVMTAADAALSVAMSEGPYAVHAAPPLGNGMAQAAPATGAEAATDGST